MISNFGLIVLQLLLILLRRQIQRVECRCKLTRRPIIHIETPMAYSMPVPTRSCLLLFFKPELHKVLKLGLDVGNDGEAGQVTQAAPLISQLLWLDHINLSSTNKTSRHKNQSEAKFTHTKMRVAKQQLSFNIWHSILTTSSKQANGSIDKTEHLICLPHHVNVFSLSSRDLW